jgi:hypothetical protein
MKKVFWLLIVLSTMFWYFSFAGLSTFDDDYNDKVYTKDSSSIINESAIEDGIQWWMSASSQNLDNVNYSEEMEWQWWMETIISNIVNYILWIVWLVALIYFLYHGFLAVTAAGDDSKFKKWMWWVRSWAIILIWIWLSWIIVTFVTSMISSMAS